MAVILCDILSACVCGAAAQEGCPQILAGWSSLEVMEQTLLHLSQHPGPPLSLGNQQLSQDYFFFCYQGPDFTLITFGAIRCILWNPS